MKVKVCIHLLQAWELAADPRISVGEKKNVRPPKN